MGRRNAQEKGMQAGVGDRRIYILVCVNIFILRSYHNNYRRPNVNNNYGRRANSMIPLEVQPRRD